MHLTPRESERLLLHSGAELARRRLSRGALLGAPDAIALVCDEICEMAWDDVPLEDVVERARRVVPLEQLVTGVASAVPRIEVEALFPHGSVLVHVEAPFGEPATQGPGGAVVADGRVGLAPGRRRERARLTNTGEQPIWVSSHVPLDQLNPALEVRIGAEGRFRLDVPAGVAVQVPAGESKDVDAVEIVRSAP